jgi:hypothetical protein
MMARRTKEELLEIAEPLGLEVSEDMDYWDLRELVIAAEEEAEALADEYEIPIEEVDRGLVEEVEVEVSEGEELNIPLRDVEFPKGTFVVDEARAEEILAQSAARKFKALSSVAYLGQGPQKEFVAYLVSAMIEDSTEEEKAILYLPVELSEYEPILENFNISDVESPEGFVAFERE